MRMPVVKEELLPQGEPLEMVQMAHRVILVPLELEEQV